MGSASDAILDSGLDSYIQSVSQVQYLYAVIRWIVFFIITCQLHPTLVFTYPQHAALSSCDEGTSKRWTGLRVRRRILDIEVVFLPPDSERRTVVELLVSEELSPFSFFFFCATIWVFFSRPSSPNFGSVVASPSALISGRRKHHGRNAVFPHQ